MSAFISILDDEAAYRNEAARQQAHGKTSFNIGNTKNPQRLHVDRVTWNKGERKYKRILSVNLSTGKISVYGVDGDTKATVEAALNAAGEAITKPGAPYVGVFNQAPE